MKTAVTIASFFLSLFLAISVAIGIANAAPEGLEHSPLLGMPLVLFVAAAAVTATYWVSSNYDQATDKARQKVNSLVDEYETRKQVEDAKQKYESAKDSFRYVSDDTLKEKYKEMKDDGVEDMERLALEEELVDRGIIDYSPMHEKAQALKDKFSL